IVDCEHYRSMREDRIVQRVRELADRVRITGRTLQLEPMNSYERRLVHNAFKDDPDVATWSPSDSARIKQITLIKRQPKRETAHNAHRAYRNTCKRESKQSARPPAPGMWMIETREDSFRLRT